ncbi:MAG: DinB family protein [Planctomycetes bacterium]|nr:DinB family protein [Planctomycetota bacterium]
MTSQQLLAEFILATKPLFIRFLEGFDDSTRTAQATNLPNHVVWCLGHCALTMNRAAERFDNQPLPDNDFVTNEQAKGDEHHFDTETVCFDSKPIDDPEFYPKLIRAQEIFEAACDRFAQAVSSTSDAKLDEEIPFHGSQTPLSKLIMRVCLHNSAHAGQIIDLRRALGMAQVIK